MRDLSNEEKADLFPAECHLKVIAVNIVGINDELNGILERFGFRDRSFEPGTLSSGGKYISYNATLYFESYDLMKQVDAALCSVDGVKVIL